MLKTLEIQNYALIDSLHIDFDKGFSVITGETGAGKSIILGALSLILGQRAESRFIKHNEEKCTIEGVFDISRYKLQPFFEELDWEYHPEECILRREIWANGKSRAFVNDSPVYINDLKSLGEKLIDVHSQHQNLALNDNYYQLNVLDVLSQSKVEKESFRKAYKHYREIDKQLKEYIEVARKNKEEQDYLQFQLDSLLEAKLQSGEQEELESDLETITHAEDIKSSLYQVVEYFSGDSSSVESVLKSAMEQLRSIEKVFPEAEELAGRVESAYLDMKDVRVEAESRFESIEFNPEQQQIIEERLSMIYELQKKHSVQTVDELIIIRNDIDEKLQNITSLDEKIEELQAELDKSHKLMLAEANKLTNKRKSIAPKLEKELKQMLNYLGMPNAQFVCSVTTKASPDINGQDHVEFLFSANKNRPVQPVAQVASGGEISRLMLSLKSMMAGATALPTIIFDEIDTGTSGEIADKMGDIMWRMGNNMQVLTISHLPQIAAKGAVHFHVYKQDTDDSSATYMKQLTKQERVDEIARMLSGAETTEQAIANAKVMLAGQI